MLDTLDQIDVPERNKEAGFRIPMLDGYKDMGATIASAK